MDVRRPEGGTLLSWTAIELTILARSASDGRPREAPMKTVLSTLVVIAVAAFSTAARSQSAGTVAQAPPAVKAKAKSANYYPLKVGTKWHYQLDAGNGQKIQLVSQIAGDRNDRR